MGASKPKQTTTKSRRKFHYNRFKYFPKELSTEILARVASASFADLFNAKISCKLFLEVASEDYIFENVTIDSFPIISWKTNKNVFSFLEKCKESGNPEALFRQGMIDYFSELKIDSGIQSLKKAANKGHVEANYVYGIILVCHGGELRKQGLNLLCKFKRSELRVVITECRKKVRNVIRYLWVNNYIVGVGPENQEHEDRKKKRETCTCNTKAVSSLTTTVKSGWKTDADFQDNTFLCDSCLWDLEATLFCNMLRTGWFRP